MAQLLSVGNTINIPIATYLIDEDTPEEWAQIPSNLPAGSTVQIVGNGDGLVVKMKNTKGEWKTI